MGKEAFLTDWGFPHYDFQSIPTPMGVVDTIFACSTVLLLLLVSHVLYIQSCNNWEDVESIGQRLDTYLVIVPKR